MQCPNIFFYWSGLIASPEQRGSYRGHQGGVVGSVCYEGQPKIGADRLIVESVFR